MNGGAITVKHLDHINLSVTDFDQSIDWYARIFDFELVEEALQDGVRWPHSLAWYVKDPTGYEIEVALWNDDEVRFRLKTSENF